MKRELSDSRCGCGCGERTPYAIRTRGGTRKGEPLKFLHGHYRRSRETITDVRYRVTERGFRTPCWIWTGRMDPDGYGIIGEQRKAHRRAYEQVYGPIPPGHEVHHLCEQKSCVRPEHLAALTPRAHRQQHSQILDEAKVRLIRSSTKTQHALAAEFGVSRTLIGFIRRGQRWAP